MLSGCATATFYTRGDAENSPVTDAPSSEVELVGAEMEVPSTIEAGEDQSAASTELKVESRAEKSDDSDRKLVQYFAKAQDSSLLL